MVVILITFCMFFTMERGCEIMCAWEKFRKNISWMRVV